MARKLREPIPLGPFQKFIEDLVQLKGVLPTCEDLGWVGGHPDAGSRRLYRYRYARNESQRGGKNGKKGPTVVLELKFVERSLVEDALHHAHVDFKDVYPPERFPALYEDIPLEPEVFCANCQDSCSPINGVCGWCEGTFFLPLTPERWDYARRKAA
jgi:hypothetical protein